MVVRSCAVLPTVPCRQLDGASMVRYWALQMEKTEKSMAELQIEKNLAYEFDKITEAGSALQPLSGPG